MKRNGEVITEKFEAEIEDSCASNQENWLLTRYSPNFLVNAAGEMYQNYLKFLKFLKNLSHGFKPVNCWWERGNEH